MSMLPSKRTVSSTQSNVSFHTDRSKEDFLDFSDQRTVSSTQSNVSFQTDRSKEDFLDFSDQRTVSSTQSNVSFQSDRSKEDFLDFSDQRTVSSTQSNVSFQTDRSKEDFLDFSDQRPDSAIDDSVQSEPESQPSNDPEPDSAIDDPVQSEPESQPSNDPDESEEESADEMGFRKSSQGDLPKDFKIFKKEMFEKYGTDIQGKPKSQIYETNSNKVIQFGDLFKQRRAVLTKGVAGVGKTFQAKSYIKDWAKTKKTKKLTIYLEFSLLNSNQPQSMENLLNNYCEGFNWSDFSITFILDGLDQCKLPLDFENNKKLTDIKEKAPEDELLTNLLQGNLLQSAQLWILTRPSAETRIPEEFIDTVTECREAPEQQERLMSLLKDRFINEMKDTQDIHQVKKNTEHIVQSGSAKRNKVTSVFDLFKSKKEKEQAVRTVLTVADEGKAKPYVQEVIQDWSKEKSLSGRVSGATSSLFKGKNEMVFLFPLKFSSLTLCDNLSFVELLNHVFMETKQCVMSDYNNLNTVFILDGLEDYEVDFSNRDSVSDVYTPAPVSVLLCSLIRGDLLPSAHLWITSTPAAAGLLPSDLAQRTTMIRDKSAKDELQKQLRTRITQQVERKALETELFEVRGQDGGQPILSSVIFNRRGVRTLLTRGVPHIGKTVHTDLFRLAWAERKICIDTDLVLSLQLSELKREPNISLEDLLQKCLDCRVFGGCYYNEYKMTIILDGLDQCELPLDFKNNKKLTDIKEKAPVDELLTNLLQGNLLQSAQLWILTRPSAETKIPEEYIDTVTECRETSARRQKLGSGLKKELKSHFPFEEDCSHPNQKNTEHISADADQENGKKIHITTSDLFKEANNSIRTVLTTGERGVGKSYLVHKIIHEWSTPQSSWFGWFFGGTKDTEVLFPLKYSHLSGLPQTLSFVELLNHVFMETKQCVMSDYNKLNIVFILDGLENYEVDFSNRDSVSDVYTPAPMSVLLCSLIGGDLLPSAHLWITSTPAAAGLLPPGLVQRTTLIREKPDLVSQRELRSTLKNLYESVAEGIDRRGPKSASLRSIYTDLYIIEGESSEVFQQAETRQVQRGKNTEVRKETPINYQEIFNPSPQGEIKNVLTTGVAGIGKTFSSMKYMLDWAEGLSSKDINFSFPLPFRELNLKKDKELSFEELLHEFFPCMTTSEITNYDQYKVLIVLDGLDECRLDLNFPPSPALSNIHEKTPVNNLLMNLIVGNLLPKAQVWITSRPAASRRVPASKIDRVTEVRGFNNEQKEEYFRKRFAPDLAEKILLCIKEARSIYLMCYIPVFCWIAAFVLESFVQNNQGAPKTLTDLFIHFLLLQCAQANSKYQDGSEDGSIIWNEKNVKTILGLSKLAYEQLEKGHLLFTEDELIKYDLDVEEAIVYSGLLTKIRRDEREYSRPFFSFVHLSIQEFLAAFYVSHTFNNQSINVLCTKESSNESPKESTKEPALDFYKSAVDKAVKSKNGDWDLFLRFVLGLSLKTNQDLLKKLLKTSENTEQINKDTIAYVKSKIEEDSGDADMNMNLFHCLNELRDHSLVEEIKKYLQSDKNSYENFTSSKWSALTFVLLTSDEKLDVFDLKKYCKSEKVLQGMMPVVKVATKALLGGCELSELSCRDLSTSVLMSASSNLTELDLSYNALMDSGAENLSEGVRNLNCKLKILSRCDCGHASPEPASKALERCGVTNSKSDCRLAGCRISEVGCSSLVSALTSNRSSPLEKLDLSYNHPGPERARLKALENNMDVKLSKVCLDHCCEHRLMEGLKKYTAHLTFDPRQKHPRILVSGQTAKTWEKGSGRVSEICDVKVRHVFCEQELTGPWYWEVEWDGTVAIGVTYKGAATKDVIGSDDQSWAVFCSNQQHSCLDFDECAKQARTQERPHRKIIKFPSQKIALYLDWEVGTLSFYSVTSGERTLETTFKVPCFKGPLVPVFWLHSGSVTLCTGECSDGLF